MEQPALLEMRGICKNFSGRKSIGSCGPDSSSRHGPCSDGRKQRRKIDSDEMSVWHLPSGRRTSRLDGKDQL